MRLGAQCLLLICTAVPPATTPPESVGKVHGWKILRNLWMEWAECGIPIPRFLVLLDLALSEGK
jgi:hypothetical protein